jgi:predicted Rossmann-fold nucleotide-binding protein
MPSVFPLPRPASPPIPFIPLRFSLYTPAELFAGFDPAEPASFAATVDFAIYRHFVLEGGRTSPTHRFTSMMQALHDHSITEALAPILANRAVAAVMGGHRLRRDAAPYAAVARLARRLTRSGLLVSTGGGPGAMEAAHLGAALAPHPDAELDRALARLAEVPELPARLAQPLDPLGHPDPAVVAETHAWFTPAQEIAGGLADAGESLAIPTWHYGHEPTSPLASHIAKYFQNSIREEGLLAIAQQGIVYAEGKAGTIQEIFQDAAQNYYKSFSYFSPMVLLGTEYWTATYPVVAVLKSLFTPEDFAARVLVTDDVDAAARHLEEFVGQP